MKERQGNKHLGQCIYDAGDDYGSGWRLAAQGVALVVLTADPSEPMSM